MKTKPGPELIKIMKTLYKANRPPLLSGPHGTAKSECVKQAAKALGIGCIVRDLSLMEPPDLVGMPVISNGVTNYAPPSFLPTSGCGLLVIEELNRAERYMMSPCLELLTERRLNDYKLPPEWLPVATINPANAGYDVHELDPALLSRFVQIHIEPDVQSWTAWANTNGVHDCIISYVGSTANIFETGCPRSWTYASSIVKTYENEKMNDRDLLTKMLAGQVGDMHANAFIQLYCAGGCAITADDVWKKYPKIRKSIKAWTEGKKTDLLAALAHKIQVALQCPDCCDAIRKSATMTSNLKSMLGDIPADLSRSIRAAARAGGALA